VFSISCKSISLLFMLTFWEFYCSEWYYVTCAYNTLSLTALCNILWWSKKSNLMLFKNKIYIIKLQPFFWKNRCSHLYVKFKVISRSKGQNNANRSNFEENIFCKTFFIFHSVYFSHWYFIIFLIKLCFLFHVNAHFCYFC